MVTRLKYMTMDIRRKLVFIAVVACSFIWTCIGAAQTTQLTGIVRNENGEPLPGVSVKVENQSGYVITDANGRFYLDTDKLKGSIACNFLGYKDAIVPIVVGTNMDIKLSPDASLSDELRDVALLMKEARVTGTGAISTVKSDEINTWQGNGLDEALKGKLSGYYNGQIRGMNSINGDAILIVIDGVPSPTVTLNNINPKTVASVSILKDAAAKALYGPLGAQGVILVTTKKGIPGKTKVNVNANFSFEFPTVKAKMLDSYDYATLRNQALTNDGLPEAFSKDQIAAFQNGTGINNDWRKMFLKDSYTSQRYNLELNGGNEKMRYYVNAGYARNEGLYKVDWTDKYNPSSYDNRFMLTSNIDVDLFSFLNVFLNTNVQIERNNSSGGGNIINKIYSTPNTVEGPLSDGKIVTTENFPDPIYGSINYKGVNTQTGTDVNVSMGLNLDLGFLTKGLLLKGIVGYNSYYVGTRIGSYNYARYVRDETGKLVQLGADVETALSWSKSSSTYYFMNFQGILQYNRTFGNHSIEALASYLAEDKLGSNYSSGWLLPFNRIQVGGHVKYGYGNRYFAQFDCTYAGSEQMKKGNQFHFSPTGSLSWVVSNEEFLKDQSFISLLKLRGSYGGLEYDNLWNFSNRYLYANDIRQANGAGLINSIFTCALVTEGALGNAKIKWEKSYQQNYGIDISLLNSLNFSVDYWRTNQKGILCKDETTPVLGGINQSDLPYVNAGKVVNQGVDFEASYTKKLGCGLSIVATADFGWNKNEVKNALDINYAEAGYYYPSRMSGYSIGQKFGYLVDYSNGNGFFNSEKEIKDRNLRYEGTAPRVGDLIYQDLNNDGVIDEKDKAPLKGVKTMPDCMYGASVQLRYKGFDLYVQLQAETGRNAYYDGLGVFENKSQGVYLDMHKNAWTAAKYAAGENISYPALTSTTSSSLQANDFFVSNADYLRLKNVTFGYSLPDNIVKKLLVNQVRFYVTGQNLLTWTNLKFKGIDPESTSIDSFKYRMVNFGLNINF